MIPCMTVNSSIRVYVEQSAFFFKHVKNATSYTQFKKNHSPEQTAATFISTSLLLRKSVIKKIARLSLSNHIMHLGGKKKKKHPYVNSLSCPVGYKLLTSDQLFRLTTPFFSLAGLIHI